ncbi:helix-turn-helix transcriptional regulator [Ferdinandcohnia quinoae]|uniref:WYL domain-containing protein n=1 Tax=Fredinandcohnia quinoae TaxID=2918902 RepID=A0AAW5DUC1_9BACI|nr:WYL domain-containing transcriptional regulator [Fredinandcohnia sp. SECRCQ15]MCH1624226.1 WYL domain-containing protein [Fredinandcohnia sp. SECRCQ15]
MEIEINKQSSKVNRLFTIYERLILGETLNKRVIAQKLGVNEKTIQRDISDLNALLTDSLIHPRAFIAYDYSSKGYKINLDEFHWLEEKEVLAISKVLLESRAFLKNEMVAILNKLSMLCEQGTRKRVAELLRNENFHYKPINNSRELLQTIWDISDAARNKRKVKISYKKEKSPEVSTRILHPFGVIFSDFYFYLIAYIDGYDFEFPAIYRLDRIQNYEITNSHFRIDHQSRFEEGEFRKRVQFMKAGKLLKVKFRFWGPSINAVLDRLPTAEVISLDDGIATIEAEVFGNGVLMWFLSQAQFLEVLSPLELREEMKDTIRQMLDLYKE